MKKENAVLREAVKSLMRDSGVSGFNPRNDLDRLITTSCSNTRCYNLVRRRVR